MTSFVIYTNRDEMIVTTMKNETKMIRETFDIVGGRDVDDYDRVVKKGSSFLIEGSISLTMR